MFDLLMTMVMIVSAQKIHILANKIDLLLINACVYVYQHQQIDCVIESTQKAWCTMIRRGKMASIEQKSFHTTASE